MDSTAQTAPAASEIFIETVSTGDTWIRQRKQPLRPQKSSTKLLPRVTHGFNSSKTHVGFEIINKNSVAAESEIINETASTGDAWIRHSKQPMWPQKSSTKVLPRVTHGFDSANSPWCLKNLQRNCFHW